MKAELTPIYKMVKTNSKRTEHLTGFRFHRGLVLATNLNTELCVPLEGLDESLDCYVQAKNFMDATRNFKSYNLSQQGDVLTVTAGKAKVEINLISKDIFPDPTDLIKGRKVNSKTFISDLANIRSFLKSDGYCHNSSLLYIMGGHIYYTDSRVLVRTPTDFIVPETIILRKELVDLLIELNMPPADIFIDEDIDHSDGTTTFAVMFTNGGHVISTQPFDPPPMVFDKEFAFLDEMEMELVSDEFVSDLSNLLKLDDAASVHIEQGQIVVKGRMKGSLALDLPSINCKVPAKSFKKIINHAGNFKFDASTQYICFRGKALEGAISTEA